MESQGDVGGGAGVCWGKAFWILSSFAERPNRFMPEVPDQNGLNFKQIFILSSVRRAEAEIKASVFDL